MHSSPEYLFAGFINPITQTDDCADLNLVVTGTASQVQDELNDRWLCSTRKLSGDTSYI